MSFFKKFLYFIRCDIIFFISHFIPKNKNLWIFGSSFGQKYWGNTKYFFEYVNRNHPEIQTVWLTKNNKVINHINKLGYQVCDACAIKGILLTMRAYCCFITHDLFDINEYSAGGIRIIQLRRGTPFLFVRNDINPADQSFFKKFLTLKYPLFMNKAVHWDNALVIAASQEIADIYTKYFNQKKNLTIVTGYPRNDILLKPIPLKNRLKDKIDSFRAKGCNIGLFVPHGDFSGLTANLYSVNKSLKKLQTILFVHPYSYSKKNLNNFSNGFKNIVFLTEQDIDWDLYPLLPLMDFLITDYSTIFFDFLLLDKPIIFSPLDDKLDFFYTYKKITPGPKTKTWDEVTKEITNLDNMPDRYALQRKKICARFNTFQDSKSCDRVFKASKFFLYNKSKNK